MLHDSVSILRNKQCTLLNAVIAMASMLRTQQVHNKHFTAQKLSSEACWGLALQGTGDEAASFCFNLLDAGRRGLVRQDSFVAATQSCAALALHDQSEALQDVPWAEATAAGASHSMPLQHLC